MIRNQPVLGFGPSSDMEAIERVARRAEHGGACRQAGIPPSAARHGNRSSTSRTKRREAPLRRQSIAVVRSSPTGGPGGRRPRSLPHAREPAAWPSMPTSTSTPSTRERRAGTATSSTSPSGRARRASPSSAPATLPTPPGGRRSGRSWCPPSRACFACGRTSSEPSGNGSRPPAGASGPPPGSCCRWRSPPSTRSSTRPGRSTTSSTPRTSRPWNG